MSAQHLQMERKREKIFANLVLSHRFPAKHATTNDVGGTSTYFCGSFGSFFFFFFEAFGFRAGGALGFIVLLLRFGESFPT